MEKLLFLKHFFYSKLVKTPRIVSCPIRMNSLCSCIHSNSSFFPVFFSCSQPIHFRELYQNKNWLGIFIFTLLCGASKRFLKVLKAFIKPSEAPQKVLKWKFKSISSLRSGRVNKLPENTRRQNGLRQTEADFKRIKSPYYYVMF